MAIKLQIAKAIVKALSYVPHRRFLESLENPEKIFNETLKRIKTKNRSTSNVIFYETTSGTTAAKKQIPYTRGLIRSFRNMFLIWARDVLEKPGLKLSSGKIFMSISPKISESSIKDDSDYLGLTRLVVSRFFAVNPSLQAQTPELFMKKLSKQLIACKDLEILSLWSPSYFLSILDYIAKEHFHMDNNKQVDWHSLWPDLKMISCWSSAQAQTSALELQELFPGVWMQPKGLLATEAPMTIPWIAAKASLPLISEVALELKDQHGSITPCWQANIGEVYEVLVTAPNGLSRYEIGDQVMCTGYYKKLPKLDFVGRKGAVSDLVGEKLSEQLVLENLKSISKNFILLPSKNKYLLYAEDFHEMLGAQADKALRNIHHYNLARDLGQLKPVEAKAVQNLRDKWFEFNRQNGKSAGDIKEAYLISNLQRSEDFQTFVLTAEAIVERS